MEGGGIFTGNNSRWSGRVTITDLEGKEDGEEEQGNESGKEGKRGSEEEEGRGRRNRERGK